MQQNALNSLPKARIRTAFQRLEVFARETVYLTGFPAIPVN